MNLANPVFPPIFKQNGIYVHEKKPPPKTQDFSNNNARAVVTLGIPFPDISDTKVRDVLLNLLVSLL